MLATCCKSSSALTVSPLFPLRFVTPFHLQPRKYIHLTVPQLNDFKSFIDYLPCSCIFCKNLMTTLLLGRIKTCRRPRFSALEIVFRVSARTEMRTICKGNQEESNGMRERMNLRGKGASPGMIRSVFRSRERGNLSEETGAHPMKRNGSGIIANVPFSHHALHCYCYCIYVHRIMSIGLPKGRRRGGTHLESLLVSM
jgi:hypothetical protein